MKTRPRLDPPTPNFPYRISRRLNLMSIPKISLADTGEGMPPVTPRGIRKSALRGHASDRVADASYPYLWRLVLLKKMYKHKFSPEKMEYIDRLIEQSNSTMYSKLANCVLDLKKQDTKDDRKKKRGWSESEWKKHMDYISQIAYPKKVFDPPPIERGESKDLEELMKHINMISYRPEFKVYRRLSQEVWYRDPIKVSPNALKYKISDRVKKLAIPRKIPEGNIF